MSNPQMFDELPEMGGNNGMGRKMHPAAVAAIANPGKWVVRATRLHNATNVRGVAQVGYAYKANRTGGHDWDVATRTVDDGTVYGGEPGKSVVVFIKVIA